MKFMTPGR